MVEKGEKSKTSIVKIYQCPDCNEVFEKFTDLDENFNKPRPL